MPDQGKLTDQDFESVKAWFKRKFPSGMMCVCGFPNVDWVVGQTVVTPLKYTGGIDLGGPVYPQIHLACSNCGHTRYFNAIQAGLIEPSSTKSTEKQEEQDVKQPS